MQRDTGRLFVVGFVQRRGVRSPEGQFLARGRRRIEFNMGITGRNSLNSRMRRQFAAEKEVLRCFTPAVAACPYPGLSIMAVVGWVGDLISYSDQYSISPAERAHDNDVGDINQPDISRILLRKSRLHSSNMILYQLIIYG